MSFAIYLFLAEIRVNFYAVPLTDANTWIHIIKLLWENDSDWRIYVQRRAGTEKKAGDTANAKMPLYPQFSHKVSGDFCE